MKSADYRLDNYGSLAILQPLSDEARDNLKENVSAEAQWWGGGVAVEPRFVDPLVAQLTDEGWVVE